MTTYRLTMDVEGHEKLGVLVAALSKEGIVFRLDEVESSSSDSPKKKRSYDRVAERSVVCKAFFDTCEVGEVIDQAKVVSTLQQRGLSVSSYSPGLSILIKGGFAERDGRGVCRRIK